MQLSATEAGAIYVFSKLRQKFRLRATYGMSEAMIAEIGKHASAWRILHRRRGRERPGRPGAGSHDRAASPMRDLVLAQAIARSWSFHC